MLQVFIVEYLIINPSGGLADKTATVCAESADEARAKFAARYPSAVIGHVELDDGT